MTAGESSVEVREDIPLKTGKKTRYWFSCDEEFLGGSKFINIAFATLTFFITFALVIQIYYGDYQVLPHGSVATDSLECSKIGTTILKKGGNAIDAAIASAFCLAVVTPHVTGLDAEGLLIFYNHRTRLPPIVIDFSRATTAPESIPRLLLGMTYIYKEYATMPWRDLVMPSAELAKRGFLIPKMLVQAIAQTEYYELYGRLEAGQILRLEHLGITLETIAESSDDDLEDFLEANAQPVKSQALKSKFRYYDIFVPNSPSLGPKLLINFHQIEQYNFTKEETAKPEYIYRMANVMQVIFDDLKINSLYHRGTSSNIAVIDDDDNYVSLVSGMYSMFGSGNMTKEGYVADYKDGDKSYARLPVIITDGAQVCGRRIVLGAPHVDIATQIISSLLIAETGATEAVEAPRFHLLDRNDVGIEGSHAPLFDDEVIKYLNTLSANQESLPEPYGSCNVVEKNGDALYSHSDSRGGGIASRF